MERSAHEGEGSGPRVLYQGSVVILGETRHRPDDADFAESVADVWPSIALARFPVGIHAAGVEPMCGDANTAILFSVGRPYRRTSIAGRGTWTEWTEIRPDVLVEMAREHDTQAERLVPFRIGRAPVPSRAYLAHHAARRRLRRSHGVDDLLGVEERSLDLAREVLTAAFAAAGIGRRPSRHDQARKRREIVFEAQVLLNRRLGQPLALQELSDAVEVSCYHLCRLFKQETGVPIHRYRDRLRLRASLERVADGGATLLEIALDLGYSSEAHFSDAFLRAFGIRPSELRRKATRAP